MLSLERSTYYDRKKEAILLLGISLWGYADKRIQITFSYSNWMEPLLECFEEIKILEAEQQSD